MWEDGREASKNRRKDMNVQREFLTLQENDPTCPVLTHSLASSNPGVVWNQVHFLISYYSFLPWQLLRPTVWSTILGMEIQ